MDNGEKLLHARGLEKVAGHLVMLLFAVLISGSFSIGHLAAPFIDPFALNAIRFLSATLILGVAAILFHKENPLIVEAPWRFLILGGLMALYFVTMFMALQISLPVSTAAVFTLIPLMSAGFGWIFLRQTTALIVLLSLVVAAVGAVWVIFKGDVDAILDFNIGKGEIIFFVGCVAYAAYAPLVRKLNRGETLLGFSFTTLLASMLCVSILGAPAILQTDWTALPLIVWLGVGYLAIFTTAVTLFLLQFAALRLPASKVLSYGYLIPGLVILYEGFLGHGWVDTVILAGAFVTAAALVIMALASDS